jgi:hypothetical protein
MPLPEFNENGDLPPGVYRVSIDEVIGRFSGSTSARVRCTWTLSHIYNLAVRTGHLCRVVVFGSYVTAKPDPNDVDVILVMDDSFSQADLPVETRDLFDHSVAQARYGASIFWIQPSILIADSMDAFVAHWQVKRDGTKRGILEVHP